MKFFRLRQCAVIAVLLLSGLTVYWPTLSVALFHAEVDVQNESFKPFQGPPPILPCTHVSRTSESDARGREQLASTLPYEASGESALDLARRAEVARRYRQAILDERVEVLFALVKSRSTGVLPSDSADADRSARKRQRQWAVLPAQAARQIGGTHHSCVLHGAGCSATYVDALEDLIWAELHRVNASADPILRTRGDLSHNWTAWVSLCTQQLNGSSDTAASFHRSEWLRQRLLEKKVPYPDNRSSGEDWAALLEKSSERLEKDVTGDRFLSFQNDLERALRYHDALRWLIDREGQKNEAHDTESSCSFTLQWGTSPPGSIAGEQQPWGWVHGPIHLTVDAAASRVTVGATSSRWLRFVGDVVCVAIGFTTSMRRCLDEVLVPLCVVSVLVWALLDFGCIDHSLPIHRRGRQETHYSTLERRVLELLQRRDVEPSQSRLPAVATLPPGEAAPMVDWRSKNRAEEEGPSRTTFGDSLASHAFSPQVICQTQAIIILECHGSLRLAKCSFLLALCGVVWILYFAFSFAWDNGGSDLLFYLQGEAGSGHKELLMRLTRWLRPFATARYVGLELKELLQVVCVAVVELFGIWHLYVKVWERVERVQHRVVIGLEATLRRKERLRMKDGVSMVVPRQVAAAIAPLAERQE